MRQHIISAESDAMRQVRVRKQCRQVQQRWQRYHSAAPPGRQDEAEDLGIGVEALHHDLPLLRFRGAVQPHVRVGMQVEEDLQRGSTERYRFRRAQWGCGLGWCRGRIGLVQGQELQGAVRGGAELRCMAHTGRKEARAWLTQPAAARL